MELAHRVEHPVDSTRRSRVGVPSGSPGNARFRLPSSIGEVRVPARAAGRFAAGMTMIRPWTAARIDRADQLAQRDLALVLVAVVARHQEDRRPGAVLDHRDRDLDPLPSRRVTECGRLSQPTLPGLS